MTDLTRGLVPALAAAFMGMAAAGGALGQEADSWIPKEGTEQYELLKPHADFVKHMRNCCTLRDGRGNLKEEINEGQNPDYPKDRFPYIVTITQDLEGKTLETPTVVYIPRDKVITVSEAKAICKPMRILDKNSTCVPPTVNVIWAYDNSQNPGYKAGTETHRITTLYCYYPRPNMQ